MSSSHLRRTENMIPFLYATTLEEVKNLCAEVILLMTECLRMVSEVYNYVIDAKSDPRTKDWFLMQNPGPLITIILLYLYFCIVLGPGFMKNRKPFSLTYHLIIYNFIQVVFSIYIVYEHLVSGWAIDYSLKCQPVDYSNDPSATRMAAAVWWYFFGKVTELLDTVFFVLRKKNDQVSFLHLYHHSIMPICSWIGTKFVAGGHGTSLCLMNSIVHTVMYSYYLFSSLGPKYQHYLWWKRHLTQMQMVQFFLLFLHNAQLIFRECDYPTPVSLILMSQAIVFFFNSFNNLLNIED